MTTEVLTFNSATTLALIRKAGPCGVRKEDDLGWAKLLRTLGEPHGKPNLDRDVTIIEVLDSNGLDDALWVLSYAMPDNRLSRHFGAWCAEQVLHIFEAERPGDMRPRKAIAIARDDDATDAARDAARAAAWDAAWDAARDAARDAAWAAAWDAARDAARAAARAAAWDAARDAHERQLRKMCAA
jgi:hypothetical protein